MRVDPLPGAKLAQVQAEPLLDGTAEIQSVQDLDLAVTTLHVPQREEGHQEVLRQASKPGTRGETRHVLAIGTTHGFQVPAKAHLV